jgi:hypothetical protein
MVESTERSTGKLRVLVKLGQYVKAHGFDPEPADQCFYCPSATGKWVFHIAFMPHQHDFDLTADVAVRNNAIEDLVNQYDSKLSKLERRTSMTLGGELGNLSQGRQMRWTIARFSDIPEVCEEVSRTFENVGLPFLQAHSDIETIHRVLTSSDSKDVLVAPLLGPRSMRAVASAYLLGEGIGIKVLAQRLEAKLMEREDLYLKDFRALCAGLLSKNPSPVC